MSYPDLDFSSKTAPLVARIRWLKDRQKADPVTDFEADTFDEKITGGVCGGLPLQGPAANGLCVLLKRLNWRFDSRELAAAMFHFPETFGLVEAKTVLYRLGYEATQSTCRGSEVCDLPSTTILVGKDGSLFAPVDGPAKAAPKAIDLANQSEVEIAPNRVFQCHIFSTIDRTAPVASKSSWTMDIGARFGPELKLLLALMFMSNIIVIVASLSTIKIFDTVLPSRAIDTLIGVVVALVVILGFEYWLRHIRAHLVARMAGRIEYLLGTALFAKLMSLPLPMLTANSINDQVGRLKQFETVRDFFNGPFVAVALELPFAISLLAIIFFISPQLGLLTLGLVCLYIINTAIMFPHLKRASRHMAIAYQDHARFILETFENRNQITRMGIANLWRERLRPKSRRLIEARIKSDRINRLFNTIAGSTTPIAAAATIFMGAGLVIEGAITGGQLIGVTMLSSRVFTPIQQAAVSLVRVPELAGLVRQIDTMMRIESGERKTTTLTRSIAPTISLDSVSMRYPKGTNPALAGISYDVKAGETIAIRGHSGAGKSSLLRVLVGLYPIQLGTIQIGGINLSQLTAREITRNIAYVGDRATLVHGTILQNLLLLNPDQNLDHVRALLAKMGILDWIENLPDGFNTRLDHEGMAQIPPGIKALLFVAQALLGNPPILLLDETISGIPPEYEQNLIDIIRARQGVSTTLIVTQRPKHHRMCDKVFTMNNGRLTID